MRRLRFLGIVWLTALLLVAGFHVVAEDLLLFRSDAYSLSVYLIAASLVVTMILLGVTLPVALLAKRRRQTLYEGWAVLLATAICLAFLALLFGLFQSNVRLGVLLKPYIALSVLNQIKSVALILVPFMIVGVFLSVYLLRHRLRRWIPVIIERVESVGLASLLYMVLGIPIGYLAGELIYGRPIETGEGHGRHLLLVVLDGFPASYLNRYNPETSPTAFDAAIEDAMVYTEMRTSTPYTSAYFSTLYTGFVNPEEARGNLFERLQRANVGVQLIAYHRNGFPEGTLANIGLYRGLRSALLSHNFDWIPRMLGLDYHLALWYRPSGIVGKSLLRNVNQTLNSDIHNALTRILMPQLRNSHAHSERTFTVFHIGHNFRFSRVADSLPRAQFSDQDESAMIKRIRELDYRYEPSIEEFAATVRERERVNVEAVGEDLKGFMEQLLLDPLLDDTVVMVTADHGTMNSKGRFWYGFHPNEEVIRVPLILWDGKSHGNDQRRHDAQRAGLLWDAVNLRKIDGLDICHRASRADCFFDPGKQS